MRNEIYGSQAKSYTWFIILRMNDTPRLGFH